VREPGELIRSLPDESATRAAGAALARALDAAADAGAFVTLAGDLGAGKTTLVRGLLDAIGVTGPVRSPTYTLVESYPVAGRTVHHLDWYRLAGAEDLDGLGFRELLGARQWVLVEWPERVPGVAGEADLAVRLDYAPGGGRRLAITALSPTGLRAMRHLMPDRASG
jgi:tRNA threonylcarbamoyladenosine biosynthesis protein TsaE